MLGVKYCNAVTNIFYRQDELINKGYPIHSVLRKSDGEVFCIGDEVKYLNLNYGSFIITNFFIKEDGILARSEGNNYCEFVDNKLIKLPSTLTNKEEVNKQDYFLTNDEVYYTYGERREIFCLNTKSINWQINKFPEMYKQLTEEYDKFFYSENKAKEYVLNNKPSLCIMDVRNILNKYTNLNAKVMFPNYEKDFVELVKQKLEL